jgi:hypothetical protein
VEVGEAAEVAEIRAQTHRLADVDDEPPSCVDPKSLLLTWRSLSASSRRVLRRPAPAAAYTRTDRPGVATRKLPMSVATSFLVKRPLETASPKKWGVIANSASTPTTRPKNASDPP